MNEHDFGPKFTPPQNRLGGMGSQRGILVLDVVRAPTMCKTGLGAETDETQRVAQITGAPGNGREVRFWESVRGPISLRPAQA